MLGDKENSCLGDRVALEYPWKSSTDELNKNLVKRIEQVSNQEKKSELKNNIAFSKHIKNYIAAESDLLERCVVKALVDMMDDAEIIQNNYDYESYSGDLDGLVVGKWKNREVIVFCEAKHNMNTSWKKASTQLFDSLKYWEQLTVTNIEEDSIFAEDYKELHVKEHGHRVPMFAFGCVMLSSETKEKLKSDIHTPCFFVTPNTEGVFGVDQS